MTEHGLYHTLGVDGYTATRCWEKEGVFCFQMKAPSSCHRCPKCGRGDTIHRGTFDRTVHAPPNGRCRTQLFIKGPRMECRICQ
jgi:transposase